MNNRTPVLRIVKLENENKNFQKFYTETSKLQQKIKSAKNVQDTPDTEKGKDQF